VKKQLYNTTRLQRWLQARPHKALNVNIKTGTLLRQEAKTHVLGDKKYERDFSTLESRGRGKQRRKGFKGRHGLASPDKL